MVRSRRRAQPDRLVDPVSQFSADAFLALHSGTDLIPWGFRVPEAVLVGLKARHEAELNVVTSFSGPGSAQS